MSNVLKYHTKMQLKTSSGSLKCKKDLHDKVKIIAECQVR